MQNRVARIQNTLYMCSQCTREGELCMQTLEFINERRHSHRAQTRNQSSIVRRGDSQHISCDKLKIDLIETHS
jgi:hypothetical protein